LAIEVVDDEQAGIFDETNTLLSTQSGASNRDTKKLIKNINRCIENQVEMMKKVGEIKEMVADIMSLLEEQT